MTDRFKAECGERFETNEDAETKAFDFIEVFNNSGAIRAHNPTPTSAAATSPVYNGAISRPVFGCGCVRRS
jgi:hypothetical protein